MRILATSRWQQGARMARLWLVAGVSLTLAPALAAQSSQQSNPFPDDAPQQPAPATPPAKPQAKPGSTTPDATAKPKSENPFPGEDPDAPIIPADPGAAANPGSNPGSNPGANPGANPASYPDSDAADSGSARRDADPDGDPVRSPDPAGNYASGDGFASSRSGITAVPSEDSDEPKPVHGKSKASIIKEDIDVGGFYLDRKNWKAAQGRFASAFALDGENPDSVWGLAESERHLQLYKEAAEHYKLFLSYEPDGRRGRDAKKALAEVEASLPKASAASKVGQPAGNLPN